MAKMAETLVCILLAVSLGAHGATATARSIRLGTTSHIIGRDGLCLDVIGGFDDNHVPTQLWPCGPQKNQLWTIQTDGTIRSMGKCLITYGKNVGDYAMINDCEQSSADVKTWKLWPDGTFSHVYSGLVLTATTAGQHTIPTLEKNQYATSQSWVATDDLKPTVAKIIGLYGMCLQAQENYRVWLNNCDGGSQNQNWAFYSDGTVRPVSDASLCLASAGTSSDDVIGLSKCEGSVKQRWYPKDDGTIVNLYANLVVDVRGSDPSLHQIILYELNGGSNQKWKYS